MSEETQNTETESQANELEVLKARAKILGITFSNNIKVETLREKINAKLEGEQEDETEEDFDDEDEILEDEQEAPSEVNPLADDYQSKIDAIANNRKLKPTERKMQIRQLMVKEQMRLVRLRITNLDPKKKDLPGEIITFGNKYLGTVRKFVPFGEVTDDGYHVPYCIYKYLDSRRFLNIRTRRDKRTGAIRVESHYAKEFALEVLPQLTEVELARLANAQAAAGSLSDN